MKCSPVRVVGSSHQAHVRRVYFPKPLARSSTEEPENRSPELSRTFCGFNRGRKARLKWVRRPILAANLPIAAQLFLRPRRSQGGSLAGKLELRSRREVLNVILQIIRTRQSLAVEGDLATGCADKANTGTKS